MSEEMNKLRYLLQQKDERLVQRGNKHSELANRIAKTNTQIQCFMINNKKDSEESRITKQKFKSNVV